MSTIAILIAVVIAGGAIAAIGSHLGWWADSDGDKIPDAVEDKVEDIKEKIADVKAEVKEVAEEVVDVVRVIQGKPTKAKLNSMTKQQLVDAAKSDFDTDIDISLKKSNIVNKVYSLYNK